MQVDNKNLYAFFSCTNAECRFRFPSPTTHPYSQQCAKCGSKVEQVGTVADAITTAVSPPTLQQPLCALLDNIRSIHNVGSIFRTADGVGISHLYLCGITSTPKQPKLAKAALGAEKSVGWSQHNNGMETAVLLKQQGHQLIALETTPNARPLFDDELTITTEPIVLVVGNEKAGIDPGILDQCEQTLYLPMLGHKASLNVAVAFGIAAYQLTFGH